MAKVKEYPIYYRKLTIKDLHEMSENGLLTVEFQINIGHSMAPHFI